MVLQRRDTMLCEYHDSAIASNESSGIESLQNTKIDRVKFYLQERSLK